MLALLKNDTKSGTRLALRLGHSVSVTVKGDTKNRVELISMLYLLATEHYRVDRETTAV